MDGSNLLGFGKQYLEIIEAIIENMPIPISVVDYNERFALINRSYEAAFNLNRANLLGKHYSVNVGVNEPSIHKIAQTTREYCSGTKVMGKNDRLVKVEGFPIIIDGQLVCSVAVIHELSSVKGHMVALNEANARLRDATLQKADYTFKDIIHKSESIKSTIRNAKRAASTDVTVLLRGESGTGKELFAQSIHNASLRCGKPFISVNCTAIAESLLESILFGYAGQAFTGAKREGAVGLFEAANGGTIFLDEVGDMSSVLQMSLLRVLQEKEIMRVGETKPRSVDVRIIAATNADLEARVIEGKFRRDLYYRLCVYPIEIPPLRNRQNDLQLLTLHFIRKYAKEFRRNVSDIDESCWPLILQHSWPGNIRELQNTIMRGVVNAGPEAKKLLTKDISFLKSAVQTPTTESKTKYSNGTYKDLFMQWEKDMLQDVYTQEKYNKTQTAKRLALSVRSVYEKLKIHGIQ
ncbi:MAG: sigma-54 interaction domain-containing protein [Christensenellales bacterium]